MGRLVNRSPRTEQLNLRVTPEVKHGVERVAAKLDTEPADWLRDLIEDGIKRELGEAA